MGSFSALSQSVLTNKDIVSLTESKIVQSLISTKVKSPNFDLSSKGIIDLKSNKVSDRIISEMVESTDFSTPISNQDIVELNNNKITFLGIKSLIRKAPNNFDLDTDGSQDKLSKETINKIKL